jgi:hypothetical protein
MEFLQGLGDASHHAFRHYHFERQIDTRPSIEFIIIIIKNIHIIPHVHSAAPIVSENPMHLFRGWGCAQKKLFKI